MLVGTSTMGAAMWREMRRKNQQLSQQECEDILSEGKRGTLAVLGDDGYPYAVPLDYTYRDGCLYFHGAPTGHKLDAIDAYDKCSFCVLSEPQENEGAWWLTFRSVIAFGRIRRITDPDRMRSILWEIGEKYLPTMEGEGEHIERVLGRIAVLELEVEHLTGKLVNEK